MRRSIVFVSRVERTATALAMHVVTIVETTVLDLTQSTEHIRKSHTPIEPSNPLRELLPRIPGTHQKNRTWKRLSASAVLHTQMIFLCLMINIEEIAPGKKGASVTPRKMRTTSNCAKFCTAAVAAQTPPQTSMVIPRYSEGRMRVMRRFEGSCIVR